MIASPTTPNNRASLLSGLRTGGVRSVSSPLAQVPHTAGATTSFVKPRISYSALRHSTFPEEDEDRTTTSYTSYHPTMINEAQRPQTAAVDSMNNRMAQQQQRSGSGLNANSPVFIPGGYAASTPKADTNQLQAQAQAQAQVEAQNLAIQQLQMMQFEILARQLNYQKSDGVQAAYLNEALRLQMNQQQQLPRRTSAGYQAPHTAGVPQSFAHLQHAARNASHGDHDDYQPLKTAGVGGKFGNRSFSYDEPTSAVTIGQTTVISGGTSLGTPTTAVANPIPSKSDTASSWRRGGNNNSVLSGNHAPRRESPPPRVRITPPPQDQISPAPTSAGKFRPRPLSLTPQQPQPVVVADDADSASSASSPKSGPEHSSPTTPQSGSSQEHLPLSPREEASKKLYEGLGMGRASSHPQPTLTTQHNNSSGNLRLSFAPVRQPTGPPSNSEEFGPKNFASRIRQKAVGGLGVLMTGRERRLSFNEAA